MSTQRKNVLFGYFCFAVTAFAFGSFEVVSKISQGAGITSVQINFIKHLTGLLVLLPCTVAVLKKERLTLRDHFDFFVLGAMVAASTSFLLSSIPKLGSAALAGLIFSANPVFTVPFGIFLAKEKAGKNIIPTLALGVLGMFLISAHKILGAKANMDFGGLALVFSAAILFSLYSVLSKVKNHQVSKYTNLLFTLLWATVCLAGSLLVKGEPLFTKEMLGVDALWSLLWNGLFITGVGYIAYFAGMERAGVHKSTIVFFMKPAIAAGLAVLLLGEHITTNMVVGVCAVLGSMYLSSQSRKKPITSCEERLPS